MIKSEVNEKSDSVCSYPCLKKHIVYDRIVLFIDENNGFLVKTDCNCWSIGYPISNSKEQMWKYIPSLSVTLTNEP